MNVLRWIAVLPTGIVGAFLVTFPVHWLVMLVGSSEEDVFGGILVGLLSRRTLETLATAFTTPFFIIYAGSWMAPGRRVDASVALAVFTALALGGVYVLAFSGGPSFMGWSSLYYGATPVLNLAGVALGLYTVRRRWDSRRVNK